MSGVLIKDIEIKTNRWLAHTMRINKYTIIYYKLEGSNIQNLIKMNVLVQPIFIICCNIKSNEQPTNLPNVFPITLHGVSKIFNKKKKRELDIKKRKIILYTTNEENLITTSLS